MQHIKETVLTHAMRCVAHPMGCVDVCCTFCSNQTLNGLTAPHQTGYDQALYGRAAAH